MTAKMFPAALIAASVFTAPAHAGWLTITNPPVSNQISLTSAGSSHLLTLPGFGGTATVTATAVSGTGRLDLRSYAFFNPSSFSEFPANGLDPNGADQYVVEGTGGSAGVSVEFDFSALAGGVLPAGSIFTVFDLDQHESLTNLTAFNGSQINTPWLTEVAHFDANGAAGGTAVHPGNFASYLFDGNAYQFTAPNNNLDIPAYYFVTTQDIALLTFDGQANLGPRGYGVAFNASAVPEPGTFALVGLAGLALGVVRRRR